MAKAKAIKIEPCFSLELSHDEAVFILDVMRKIGGDMERSRRRHADNLLKELRRAGLVQTDACDSEGSIRFDIED